MGTKTLMTFRSKCTGFEEGKMEKAPIPDPCTVWEASTMTEEQIQSLADRRLLRPKSQVSWRPTAGEEFPTEGTSEIVVFLTHIECGFSVPAGDFLRRLLHFYRIELVHLALNSITIISTFVHLCEAYLGIAPHFHLWRHFFELKKMGKGVVVGNVGFMLRRNMKSEYIDLTLPENNTVWKQGWFYLDNRAPALKERTGRTPVPYPEWTNQLASRDTEELQPLLDDLEQLKTEGLTGAAVAISFCRRLIQPLQNWAHPAFEYWRQSDPTRVAQRKVSKAGMMAHAKNIFGGWIRNRECPKALEVYNLSDPVSHQP
jgi:hypothetical protein